MISNVNGFARTHHATYDAHANLAYPRFSYKPFQSSSLHYIFNRSLPVRIYHQKLPKIKQDP